ncbi:Lrp/AsnC family leucine-responsive transcriptional regulator [Microbacteriaceae bacterium SG_E_30_P1]|uniref:Lrp/AsnC family leucine-responsive transcriptional regulator n=1 Tax=Antiquaquibacter oligotrophicus TaxID=2880260 RepID=A0ABT6KJL0_9MICO|nr:Lrp/AsnC family transcriptional regulator [Antiquaquibacter oligotrophicus]MDH6180183.1 Lrp/AsnC family leucine-responsive transcriptional regulator [Antiquaquibacter oligotrophicus]UDF14066.1 Lrp/AsnC family transcriptional regulator [Antiquaquibacter oligotrophicus]
MDAESAMDAANPMSRIAAFATAPQAAAALDDIDRQLLVALSHDGRKSHRALAREIPLSPPAIGERIARLERLGVIQGYTVRIGWPEVGFPIVAHLAISITAGADLAAIMDAISELPELEAAHIVTGQWDVLVRFRVADHRGLQTLVLAKVWQIPGIQRVETNLELARVIGDSTRLEGTDDSAP